MFSISFRKDRDEKTHLFKVQLYGQHFSSTCFATLLHCKLKLSVARITTFVTNLSRNKIQCCKSAEVYTCDW